MTPVVRILSYNGRVRADRLLSILMLLQTRGKISAEQLAEELEVSTRTIYRDITALSSSGVPVYCERGPGGGISLVEEYRTTLTGLNPAEARALFMLSIPEPLRQLGVGEELQAAMRKLSAALPDSRRREEIQARQRIHLDSTWWFQVDSDLSCLPVLQQAVWSDHLLRMTYRTFFDRMVELTVKPYGLVAKANLWHLVFARGEDVRVVRVSRVVSAEIQPQIFNRPADFDLVRFWKSWCREYEAPPPFIAQVKVSPGTLAALPYLLEARSRPVNASQEPDAQGWVTLDLRFESLPTARTHLLGMGRGVEVLQPEALRRSLIDYAQQISAFYGEHSQE